MFARRIVAKHVTKTTALAMLGATAVLSGLQVLFTYLGELGSLKEGYGALDALWHVLWGAPGYLYEILPIAALIGAVLGLGTLASNSELIVMRAAGISLWRIVGWVVRSARSASVKTGGSHWLLAPAAASAPGARSGSANWSKMRSMRGWSQAWNWRRTMATRSATLDNSRTLPA